MSSYQRRVSPTGIFGVKQLYLLFTGKKEKETLQSYIRWISSDEIKRRVRVLVTQAPENMMNLLQFILAWCDVMNFTYTHQ